MKPDNFDSRADFLSIPELASKLGVSPRSIWRRIKEGLIPKHSLGGVTRISRADADNYIARCRRLQQVRCDEDRMPTPPRGEKSEVDALVAVRTG